ncbi:archease [Candidatus Woesearchaeota archaeon]|nr:archease [Candidatus Woesearchaeota archaeon]
MVYEFLEHTADVGIKCSGETLEEAFAEGGKALFDVMVDIKQVDPIEVISFEVDADSIESLFIEFLNYLLAMKDINEAVYCEFEVDIKKENEKYYLNAIARGEKLDYDKHEIRTEVKSATYHGLSYDEKTNTLITVLDV